MISLIAAIGKNNELGKNNTLLFHMPADMKFFRDTTRGHTVIMGRKTFESLSGPLPKRRNIVITRDKEYKKEGIEVVHSLEEAIQQTDSEQEAFVIGGAEIYKQAITLADRLYITHIDAEDSGADSFFPEIIPIMWNEIKHDEHKKDVENPYNYTFSLYEKFI
jgi:dihydrofolate reductase